jgi:hypothetical protein
MNTVHLASAALLVPLLAFSEGRASTSGQDARKPVLVELFTSEGCSSCPPADVALARLEREQPAAGAQVIALELHVDYWNSLGWSDPFSSADFTARQEDYARAFHLNSVYTPQLVVDGQKQLVGGSNAVSQIAEAARQSKWPIRISIGARSPRSIQVQLDTRPAAPTSPGDEAELWLAITEASLETDVRRGENAGRRLKHAAVVRRLKRLAALPSGGTEPATFTSSEGLDPSWAQGNLRVAAFIQERRSRRVLGAATLPLAAP